jgi:hypothetical protein
MVSGALVLGISGAALAVYADLEKEPWRTLARGGVVINLIGLLLARFW